MAGVTIEGKLWIELVDIYQWLAKRKTEISEIKDISFNIADDLLLIKGEDVTISIDATEFWTWLIDGGHLPRGVNHYETLFGVPHKEGQDLVISFASGNEGDPRNWGIPPACLAEWKQAESVESAEPMIQLNITIPQAQATAKALDLFARLSIGQIGMVSEMIAHQDIPMYANNDEAAREISPEVCNIIRDRVNEIASLLGYHGTGHSLGVGNKHVPIAGHRAYEISRVLEKTLAEYTNPNPKFHGVNYDGLILRYTQDPAPVAVLTGISAGVDVTKNGPAKKDRKP